MLSNTLFPKVIPSSVHIPMKQLTVIETVIRKNTQVLSYVNWFLKAIGKTTSSMEQLLQQTDHNFSKECELILAHLHTQTSCLNSLDKALETVTGLSIALACNLQLARRDSILKVCAPYLHEHYFNRLKRTGFKAGDLFCAAALDQIQKKHERSPKRQKLDSRQSFHSKRHGEDRRSSGSQGSYSSSFHGQSNTENNPTRHGGK